jgi:hypothetical protein
VMLGFRWTPRPKGGWGVNMLVYMLAPEILQESSASQVSEGRRSFRGGSNAMPAV